MFEHTPNSLPPLSCNESHISHQGQPSTVDVAATPSTHGETDAAEDGTGLPLKQAFFLAVSQNSASYDARKRNGRYTSPLFKLVQCLRSHPDLKGRTAEEALQTVTDKCKPDWGCLFPDVTLPSLEFVTAWEQVKFPSGTSPWEVARELTTNEPLTMLDKPTCEGYEHYLGVGFHFQRLTPRQDILLPVKPMSGVLTALMAKIVSEQSVSGYCRLAI